MLFISFLAWVAALSAVGIALWTLWRGWRSIDCLLFGGCLIATAAESYLVYLGADAVLSPSFVWYQETRLTLLAVLPGCWLLFSGIYARGNRWEFLMRWRSTLLAALGFPLLMVLFFRHNLISRVIQTPDNETWQIELGRSGVLLQLAVVLGAILVLLNLERTFRAAVGTMRWQIKLVLVGLAVLFAARIYTSTQAILYSAMDMNHEILNNGALLVACVLTGISLVRTGGAKVDVYPSPEVIKNSFTVLVAGSYLLTVGLIAKMVTWIGGSREFPILALFILLALTLLSLLLLSDRLRQRGQRFLARHFCRPIYDYRKVWSTFTERTAPKMDEKELCRSVVDWISETLNVLSVSIWLTDRARQGFWLGAATIEIPPLHTGHSLKSEDVVALMDALGQQSDPVDLEVNQDRWAMLLKQLHPDIFAKGGHRICSSLQAGGELQGVLVMGDRVEGIQFSSEDDDLIKCISDQVGSLLLKIRLARRLYEAKEMEAMQTMAAFLVHDLKNTASGLSLMLQNLPRHFENPDFRQDALKTLAANVAHINDLIRRVNVLREGLVLKPCESDLGKLVECTVRECEGGSRIRWEPGIHPRLVFDPEQIQKVLKNLILNALEALGREGEVRIKTGIENEWAWVEVADNGCGISQEFLNRSLFRPFQTTKKNGIGIGLFHSKMIVDAHGGRLEVSSEIGKGTRFRLFLPVRSVPETPSPRPKAVPEQAAKPVVSSV